MMNKDINVKRKGCDERVNLNTNTIRNPPPVDSFNIAYIFEYV